MVALDSFRGPNNYVLTPGAEIEEITISDGSPAGNITGNEFSQQIIGNNGDNIINGLGGNDTMTGLGGNDQYLVRGPGDVVIEANGGGTDTVFTTVSYNLGVNEVEVLSTVVNADSTPIDLIGNFATQTVIGNYANNVLNGGSSGNDVLIGLRGDDLYAAGSQSIKIVENAGEGNDTLVVFGDYQLRSGVSVEVLSAQNRAGTEAFTLRGNEVTQTVAGNAGNNVVDGRGGNDVLIGGAGADMFAFTAALGAGNIDSLVDFLGGTDKVGLASDIFVGVAGGVTAGSFVLATVAADADDRVLYDQATGRLFYDADANGAGVAVQFAQLAAGTVLSAADFTIVAPVGDLPA